VLSRSWAEFEAEVPDLAAFVRERLEAHKHRMMATLRSDGSPRIGGIEVTIARWDGAAGAVSVDSAAIG
jgi:hypothetical protein